MKTLFTANIPLAFLLALGASATSEQRQSVLDARLVPGSLRELLDVPAGHEPDADVSTSSKTHIAQACVYGYWRRC